MLESTRREFLSIALPAFAAAASTTINNVGCHKAYANGLSDELRYSSRAIEQDGQIQRLLASADREEQLRITRNNLGLLNESPLVTRFSRYRPLEYIEFLDANNFVLEKLRLKDDPLSEDNNRDANRSPDYRFVIEILLRCAYFYANYRLGQDRAKSELKLSKELPTQSQNPHYIDENVDFALPMIPMLMEWLNSIDLGKRNSRMIERILANRAVQGMLGHSELVGRSGNTLQIRFKDYKHPRNASVSHQWNDINQAKYGHLIMPVISFLVGQAVKDETIKSTKRDHHDFIEWMELEPGTTEN